VPVAASSGIDPNTRLDVTLGSVYAVVKDWDVYVEGSIVDRGDAGMATTMLPILDGGFDQRQLTVGVVYRMERGDRRSAPLALARPLTYHRGVPPCVFCAIVHDAAPASIVIRRSAAIAFMDIRPWRRGHVLCVPTRHGGAAR
jgi:hypothetical protein